MVLKGEEPPTPFKFDIISNIIHKTTFIVIKVEIPFKCNIEDFDEIYQKHYKKRISHEFIRRKLGLSDSVRLKLNGTFKRELQFLDKENCIRQVTYQVQTALWFNNGKWQYVSIFPDFIKRYCRPGLHIIEYISCKFRKGEDFFKHIDDPEAILDCEDSVVMPTKRIEKECMKLKYSALLNSRYAEIYNRSLPAIPLMETMMFPALHNLVLTARFFFGENLGVFSYVNNIIRL